MADTQRKTRNISISPEAQEALWQVSEHLSSVLGFRVTLTNTILWLARHADFANTPKGDGT